MALCTICQKFDSRTILLAINKDWPQSPGSKSDYYWHEQAKVLCFTHYDNIYLARQSASAGCKLCEIISATYKGKEAEVDEIAGNLPVVLHGGWDSKLKASFVSLEEGLVTLCALDISISHCEFSFIIPALVASQVCVFRSQNDNISCAGDPC
jgi:hypothetical protein